MAAILGDLLAFSIYADVESVMETLLKSYMPRYGSGIKEVYCGKGGGHLEKGLSRPCGQRAKEGHPREGAREKRAWGQGERRV